MTLEVDFEETKIKNLNKALVTCKEEQAFEGFYKQTAKFRHMQSEISQIVYAI